MGADARRGFCRRSTERREFQRPREEDEGRCPTARRMRTAKQKMQWVQLVWSGLPAGSSDAGLGIPCASCRQISKPARHRRHLQGGKSRQVRWTSLRGDRIGDDNANQRSRTRLDLILV